MKTIIQLIVNLGLLISYYTTTFIAFLWYGKLPKVSPYHMNEKCNLNFKDINYQGNIYHDKRIELHCLSEYNRFLYENERVNRIINTTEIPIYDRYGKVRGSQSLYSFLQGLTEDFEEQYLK